MADTYKDTGIGMLQAFRVKITEMPDTPARASLKQAVDSFARFLDCAEPGAPLDASLASGWAAWMFAQGYSYKTASYYVSRLSSLYNKVAAGDCFAAVRERLKGAPQSAVEVASVEDCYGKLRALAAADCSASPLRRLGNDLVLYSLYSGGLSPESAAKAKKGDCLGGGEELQAIAARHARPKSKYLFPLRQPERTPRQLAAAAAAMYADALRAAGIRLRECSAGAAAALWAAAAWRCGVSAPDIAACLGPWAGASLLSAFAAPSAIGDGRKAEIRRHVAGSLARDPEDWYAMQFRPRVDYGKVRARLAAAGIALAKAYYPMEEIARRVGRRIRREQKPVVPGLLFFKSRAADLPGIFGQIGDLAWGYRRARGARAPYAAIPQAAIDAYQRAVGQFADAVDAYPSGSLAYEPGDPVTIVGGDYAGLAAVFEKEQVETAAGASRVTARLRLTGLSLSWTVTLDPRQLSPAGHPIIT